MFSSWFYEYIFLILKGYVFWVPRTKILSSVFTLLRYVNSRASLAVQWLGILLPMQGTGVWSHVLQSNEARVPREAPASTTEPTHRNYWSSYTPEPMLHKRGHHDEKPEHCTKRCPHSPQLGKAHAQQWRPSTVRSKKKEKTKKKKNERMVYN